MDRKSGISPVRLVYDDSVSLWTHIERGNISFWMCVSTLCVFCEVMQMCLVPG